MGQFSQVDKLVTFLLDAVPMLATVVFTTGVAVDREASAVMQVDQTDHQMCHRMIMEIAG
jgi:hypothetical protein